MELGAQDAGSTGFLDLGFSFFTEIFSLHDDWNLWQMSSAHKLIKSLKNLKKKKLGYLRINMTTYRMEFIIGLGVSDKYDQHS